MTEREKNATDTSPLLFDHTAEGHTRMWFKLEREDQPDVDILLVVRRVHSIFRQETETETAYYAKGAEKASHTMPVEVTAKEFNQLTSTGTLEEQEPEESRIPSIRVCPQCGHARAKRTEGRYRCRLCSEEWVEELLEGTA